MSHEPTAIAPQTILAIDDHEDNLFLLETWLESQGFRVLTALDGPAGLETARSARPDLILLDLAMPGMDGFEVLERLRQAHATSRIPVIVLTANVREAAMVERGLALGANEYLTKPIQMDELVVRLRSTLRLSSVERELERLRRDFASMLVHDMRAPLDGIRLTLGVLRRQEPQASPKWQMLDDAMGAIEDVDRLVDDLLHDNRLDDEGFTAKTHPLALGALVERSLKTLRPLAEARELALDVVPMDGLPLVNVDPALVKRVLDNLVGNALKFTESGRIAVSAMVSGEAVCVSITDTGPGIATEAQARIFDRYFHIAQRKQTRQGGFGLGLAFCAKAVGAMGGTIGVASTPGQGSEFWFTVPIAMQAGSVSTGQA